MKQKVKEMVDAIYPTLVEIRRDFHRHPEFRHRPVRFDVPDPQAECWWRYQAAHLHLHRWLRCPRCVVRGQHCCDRTVRIVLADSEHRKGLALRGLFF